MPKKTQSNTGTVRCAKCRYFKTRCFRDPIEFDRFVKQKFVSPTKALAKVNKRLLDGEEVRIYWCDLQGSGPYLSVSRRPMCKEFSL